MEERGLPLIHVLPRTDASALPTLSLQMQIHIDDPETFELEARVKAMLAK